jgi:dGTPase
VAYSVHDLEDGMWAGLVTLERLRRPRTSAAVRARMPQADLADVEAVFGELEPVLATTGERGRKAARKTWSSFAIYEMVHAASAELVDDGGRGPRYARVLRVKPRIVLKSRILKAVAEELVFRHRRVSAVLPRSERVVGGLFKALMARPELIPEEFREAAASRGVCDYISGMTDDFAERMFASLAIVHAY